MIIVSEDVESPSWRNLTEESPKQPDLAGSALCKSSGSWIKKPQEVFPNLSYSDPGTVKSNA